MCPYTRVCYPHTRVHTYTNFARVYVPCFHMLVQFVCVRVCVFPSEMECVLFYSRKIAHRANVICCIMYPTLNKFYLILSYLSWSIAWRRCSNYIFILGLTSGFKGLGKDSCNARQETFKFWDIVRLILEILRYLSSGFCFYPTASDSVNILFYLWIIYKHFCDDFIVCENCD